MPPITLIPSNQGVPLEMLQEWLARGFVYVGRAAVKQPAVLTADQIRAGLKGGTQDVDIWMQRVENIDLNIVASALFNAFQAYPEARDALNMICEPILGITIDDLASQALAPDAKAPLVG